MNPKSLFCIISLVLLAACGSVLAKPRPPNIIYINTDDLGIGKISPLGMDPVSARIIKMPHLDQLKKDGMTFTEAYAGNAVCGPSRCTLLSGKHPGHAAWRANRKTMPEAVWPPDYPLLGTVARDAGYVTAAFGKVSAGGTMTPEQITETGWDYWLGYLGHVDCRSFYNDHIWENGVRKPIPENAQEKIGDSLPVLGDKGIFIEDLYADKIIDFITTHKDRPFFVYFASTVPHGDSGRIPFYGLWTPSLEGYDQYPELSQREQLYCALITRHDRNVGRIRAAVEKLGLAENTIIIWTSDNGDENSYYGHTDTFDGNGPFRARKRSLYEGGIRVPMIAYWDGTIPPGSVSVQQTTQVDLMPTLADAGGKPVTDEMDGISILPTLRGEPERQTPREYLYFEFYEGGQQQSVRMGDWKAYRKGGWNGTIELYDLSKDIGETTDLAKQHPELIERLAGIMKKEHELHPIWNLDEKKKK